MGLKDFSLTAGCLFQTLWNQLSSKSPEWGIKDYDVFYLYKGLLWEAEDRAAQAVKRATADLPIKVEIKNQARVHLWYRERFGGDYPQLASSRSGIDLYLISFTSVGIDVQDGELYAPNRLSDLAAGVLRITELSLCYTALVAVASTGSLSAASRAASACITTDAQ